MSPDLTVREVAVRLGLAPYTVREYAKAGQIGGAYQPVIGGNWRFDADVFAAWKADRVAAVDPHRIEPRSARSRAAQSRRTA